MSFQAVKFVQAASHITGAARAVLYALAARADRGGCNIFPSQAQIAADSGVSERHVRRCLDYLEGERVIARMGRRRSRRGRPVVVWRIILGFLKGDMASDRSVQQVKTFVKKAVCRGAPGGEQRALNDLAARVGWDTLMRWDDATIQTALRAA